MPSVCVQSSRQESREEGETSPLDWILLQQWQMWRHFATPDNTWWALTQLKDSTLNCPSTKENSATKLKVFQLIARQATATEGEEKGERQRGYWEGESKQEEATLRAQHSIAVQPSSKFDMFNCASIKELKNKQLSKGALEFNAPIMFLVGKREKGKILVCYSCSTLFNYLFFTCIVSFCLYSSCSTKFKILFSLFVCFWFSSTLYP